MFQPIITHTSTHSAMTTLNHPFLKNFNKYLTPTICQVFHPSAGWLWFGITSHYLEEIVGPSSQRRRSAAGKYQDWCQKDPECQVPSQMQGTLQVQRTLSEQKVKDAKLPSPLCCSSWGFEETVEGILEKASTTGRDMIQGICCPHTWQPGLADAQAWGLVLRGSICYSFNIAMQQRENPRYH